MLSLLHNADVVGFAVHGLCASSDAPVIAFKMLIRPRASATPDRSFSASNLPKVHPVWRIDARAATDRHGPGS